MNIVISCIWEKIFLLILDLAIPVKYIKNRNWLNILYYFFLELSKRKKIC